jgi:hypothetical protein
MKRALAIAAWVFALASCVSEPAEKPPQNGGGSDTETLTGLVFSKDGLAAVGVAVKLLPADFDPSQSDTALLRRAVTDSLGRFRFEKVDTGRTWNLIAGNPQAKTWSLSVGRRAGDSVALTLGPAKVMLVTLHSSAYATADSGIAYFPGTDILARCDGRTTSKVDSIPAAVTRFVIASRSGWRYDTTWVSQADTTKVVADKNRITISP